MSPPSNMCRETGKKIIEIVDNDDLEVYAVHQTPDGMYHVTARGMVRHTPCTAEDAMRALAHYLQSATFELENLKSR